MAIKIPPSTRTQESADTPFDPVTTAGGCVLVSEDAQAAIEEVCDQAPGAARFIVSLTYNGTPGNNTFIGYLNTIPGNLSPVVLPIKCQLNEFTFSNLKSNADYTLEFRKNSTGGAAFLSVSKVNTQFFYQDNITENFNPGDRIYVKYKDDGNNAQDLAIILYFRKLP